MIKEPKKRKKESWASRRKRAFSTKKNELASGLESLFEDLKKKWMSFGKTVLC
jgi:hypothetical protein